MPELSKGFGTLTHLQKEFIQILASLPDKDQFYLAGGTALAEYYLGHRLSFDLDYFTGTENLVGSCVICVQSHNSGNERR